jgi:UDP-N-acetylmuramoyl-L-alanine---L-glutamate ligase
VYARGEPTLVLTLPDGGPRIAAAFSATATAGTGIATAATSTATTGNLDSPDSSGAGFRGVRDFADLETAVREAFAWAKPDGIVLLSPAAPSFGHFRDYRDRGDQFAAAMRTQTR